MKRYRNKEPLPSTRSKTAAAMSSPSSMSMLLRHLLIELLSTASRLLLLVSSILDFPLHLVTEVLSAVFPFLLVSSGCRLYRHRHSHSYRLRLLRLPPVSTTAPSPPCPRNPSSSSFTTADSTMRLHRNKSAKPSCYRWISLARVS